MLRAQMLEQAAKVAHFLPSLPAVRFVSGTDKVLSPVSRSYPIGYFS